jgi:hypothetical protein
MILKCNAMERLQVVAGVPQGSPVSLIHFVINTSALIKWVDEYVSAKGLSFAYDLSRVATGFDIIQVITIFKRCAATNI